MLPFLRIQGVRLAQGRSTVAGPQEHVKILTAVESTDAVGRMLAPVMAVFVEPLCISSPGVLIDPSRHCDFTRDFQFIGGWHIDTIRAYVRNANRIPVFAFHNLSIGNDIGIQSVAGIVNNHFTFNVVKREVNDESFGEIRRRVSYRYKQQRAE